MQKILYIVSALKRVGPINVLEGLIKELDKERFMPIIVCLRGEDLKGNDDRFKELGAKIYHLDCSLIELELSTITAVNMVRQIAEHEDVKIVHSHGYHADLVCSYLSKKKYKKVSTQHNISKEDFTYNKGLLTGKYMAFRLKNALNSFTTVVGISEFVSNYNRKRLKERVAIKTIYNGIDTEYFDFAQGNERNEMRQELGFKQNDFIFLSVGNLTPLKDPKLIISAFSELIDQAKIPDEARLVMLGTGEQLADCKALAKPYGGQILMRGFTKDVAGYLHAGDCLISASHSEGFGLNVAEALASGLKAMVSDLPVHQEVLQLAGLDEEEVKASTFPIGDKNALKAGILHAMKAPLPKHINTEALDNKRMSRCYQELYDKLLS